MLFRPQPADNRPNPDVLLMTIQAENTPTTSEPPAQIFDERVFVQLSALARAVNRTHGRMMLYGLAASIVVVVIATAAVQVRLNAWNQPFYDAIQTRAFGAFVHQLMVFFVIAA